MSEYAPGLEVLHVQNCKRANPEIQHTIPSSPETHTAWLHHTQQSKICLSLVGWILCEEFRLQQRSDLCFLNLLWFKVHFNFSLADYIWTLMMMKPTCNQSSLHFHNTSQSERWFICTRDRSIIRPIFCIFLIISFWYQIADTLALWSQSVATFTWTIRLQSDGRF